MALFENPNRFERLLLNSREFNEFAPSDSFVGLRAVASIFAVCWRNGTRNDTRRDRLPKFHIRRSLECAQKCPRKWIERQFPSGSECRLEAEAQAR
jgi:hypothetical protein